MDTCYAAAQYKLPVAVLPLLVPIKRLLSHVLNLAVLLFIPYFHELVVEAGGAGIADVQLALQV